MEAKQPFLALLLLEESSGVGLARNRLALLHALLSCQNLFALLLSRLSSPFLPHILHPIPAATFLFFSS